MCGIIACLSKNPINVYELIYNGLLMIQNRGYDSAGICTLINEIFENTKFASTSQTTAFENLKTVKHSESTVGIGHTRWATHGSKTTANAHPHLDNSERFALVHNGIIVNYIPLKKFLLAQGYHFKSETDSEVIVNLIAYHYTKIGILHQAIQRTCEELQGTWALVILFTETPDTIYLCKHGSPLLVGFGDQKIMVASELAGFCNLVSQYIILENHDIVSFTCTDSQEIISQRYKIHEIQKTEFLETPAPYPHWMLKEINEQPESLMRSINNGGRISSPTEVKLGGLDPLCERLLTIKNLIIIASGTSLHAGLYGIYWLKKLKCFHTVHAIEASEFTLDDLPASQAGVLVLSQSGETKDVHRAVELIKSTDTPVIGVINVVDSSISREVDCGIYLNAGRENAVASTKSFTSQCMILNLIAVWFSQHYKTNESRRSTLISNLLSASYKATDIITNYNESCKKIATLLFPHTSCYLLGRGPFYPIALEASLKLKEIGLLHAEGYCGGALKHGPFALIGPQSYVIILDDRTTQDKTASTIEEIKSRHGKLILISNYQIDPDMVNYHLYLEDIQEPFLYILIWQLVSYYLAILKDQNPDYPRNLAKVVTVDG